MNYYQVYSAYGTLFGKFGKQIYSQNKVVGKEKSLIRNTRLVLHKKIHFSDRNN